MNSRPAIFRYWRDPLFLGCLAAYLINRELIKPHLRQGALFFHGHFNDILLVPVALPLFLWVYRRLGLRPDDAKPRSWEIALHLVIWVPFFEWFGPRDLHHGTADPVDALCYGAGGLAAWMIWRGLPRFFSTPARD